jgi:hypothetical protein
VTVAIRCRERQRCVFGVLYCTVEIIGYELGMSMKSRLLRGIALIAGTVVVPVAILGLSAVPSSATSYHSSGSITFQGAVSGTLKVNASVNDGGLPGCSISGVEKSGSSEGGTIVITWNNVKLTVGKKTQTLSFVEVSSDFAKFGTSYSMNENLDSHAGVSLLVGTTTYSSTSGTATTVKSGVSGSDNGVLKATSPGGGTVKIVGHWSGCAQPRT